MGWTERARFRSVADELDVLFALDRLGVTASTDTGASSVPGLGEGKPRQSPLWGGHPDGSQDDYFTVPSRTVPATTSVAWSG